MSTTQTAPHPAGTSEDHRDICSFCAEIERRADRNIFYELLGHAVGDSYLLQQTENFVVMPAVGSLMPGYVLVVPREHLLSFGHVPASQRQELAELLDDVEQRVAATFSPSVVFFEHGPATFIERGGSCTDHAHMHIAPVPPDVDLVSVMARDFEVRQIEDTLTGLHDQITELRGPYLFLRHHDRRSYLCDAPDALSQHLRRDLVSQLGMDDAWDWAVFPGTQHILATLESYPRSSPES